MTADWSRRESASTTHLPFNIFIFQTLFQINFCSVPIFSSDLRSVYDHVIENDNFKNVFPCFRITFCNEEHICIDIHVQIRSEAKFKEQKKSDGMERSELQEADYDQEQIYQHIFAQNRGYCVSYLSNILQSVWKECVRTAYCFPRRVCCLSVLWCNLMNNSSVTTMKRSLIIN